MLTAVQSPQRPRLWKTPVEKSVENVEKYSFSTGIPACWNSVGLCGKPCALPCAILSDFRPPACYVTGFRKILPVIKTEKCSECGAICLTKTSGPLSGEQNFVKIRQNNFRYLLPVPGNTVFIRKMQGGSPCRVK